MTAGQIRRIRMRLGLSQRAFADKLGVHYTSVAGWERGQVKPGGLSVVHLRALAKKAGLSIKEH